MTSFPASFFVHTATIETYLGRTGRGEDSYAAPVTKSGFLDDDAKLTRNATAEQVSSASRWFTDLADQALYTPGTRMTINGRIAIVVDVHAYSAPGLGLPEHLEVNVT